MISKDEFYELLDKAKIEHQSDKNNSFELMHYFYDELNDYLNDFSNLTIPQKIVDVLNEIYDNSKMKHINRMIFEFVLTSKLNNENEFFLNWISYDTNDTIDNHEIAEIYLLCKKYETNMFNFKIGEE